MVNCERTYRLFKDEFENNINVQVHDTGPSESIYKNLSFYVYILKYLQLFEIDSGFLVNHIYDARLARRVRLEFLHLIMCRCLITESTNPNRRASSFTVIERLQQRSEVSICERYSKTKQDAMLRTKFIPHTSSLR